MDKRLSEAIEVMKKKYNSDMPQDIEDIMKAEQTAIETMELMLKVSKDVPMPELDISKVTELDPFDRGYALGKYHQHKETLAGVVDLLKEKDDEIAELKKCIDEVIEGKE